MLVMDGTILEAASTVSSFFPFISTILDDVRLLEYPIFRGCLAFPRKSRSIDCGLSDDLLVCA